MIDKLYSYPSISLYSYQGLSENTVRLSYKLFKFYFNIFYKVVV